MGSLLKESLFSLLYPQKMLFPPKTFAEHLSSAQLSGRYERVSLVHWCHFRHCFTIKSPFWGPSPLIILSMLLAASSYFPYRHTITFLQVFSTWLCFSLHPMSSSSLCQLPECNVDPIPPSYQLSQQSSPFNQIFRVSLVNCKPCTASYSVSTSSYSLPHWTQCPRWLSTP